VLTEANYGDKLKTFVEVLIRPMKEAGYLDREFDMMLVRPFGFILGYAKALALKLDVRMKKWHWGTCIGDVFLHLSPNNEFLDSYAQYCTNCKLPPSLIHLLSHPPPKQMSKF